jgi:transcriptional regulator with XRE-family HTH domain
MAITEEGAASTPEAALNDAPLQLGPRLRALRRKRNLTLREVADQVGCSESHLSKIETSKITPSLMTLHRITMVVGTTISTLLSHPKNEEKIITRRGARPVVRMSNDGGEGDGFALEELMPDTKPHVLDASIHLLAPGDNSGGTISHEGEELGYVLEGQLELTVDGQTYLLSEGDFFIFRSEKPHSHRNPGQGLTRVIWINTPPSFQ